MTEPVPQATPAEMAQLDILVWLIAGRCLTIDGLEAVRGKLLHDPAFGSLPSRRTAVLAMTALANARGWPASDDPAWPPPGDPVWDVPVPGFPDDLPDDLRPR